MIEPPGDPWCELLAASPEERTRLLERLSNEAPSSRTFLTSLAEKLQRLDELETHFAETVEREKFAAMKELAYGASHEINNPLANISTRAQMLLTEETHPERRKKLAMIAAQALRAHDMISDLMLFAKPPPLRREPIESRELIDRVVREAHVEADSRVVELVAVHESRGRIEGDAVHLSVAIHALVRNAIEAVDEGGVVRIVTRTIDDRLQIDVIDNGPGIAPEARRHAFDPFYSGREAGRGLGFGLPKCRRIVELHGGEVTLDDHLPRGIIARISLPIMNTYP